MKRENKKTLNIHKSESLSDKAEKRQTLKQYNDDLEKGSDEIERGNFITAEALKIEARSW